MRDYGKVHASFWTSETTRNLSPEAQLLALYLLSCQHATMAGVYRIPLAYISEDTGWVPERLRNGFATLSMAGFLEYDEKTGWVWIKSWLKWNKPDNPNQWKAVAKSVASVPDSVSFKPSLERVSEPLGNPPSPSPSPSLVPEGGVGETIPLDDGTEFALDAGLVAALKAAYPRLDIAAETRAARAWCMAAPGNRKTRRGAAKFLTNWCARSASKLPPERALPPIAGGRKKLA